MCGAGASFVIHDLDWQGPSDGTTELSAFLSSSNARELDQRIGY
jgi:hypothetical protein